MEVGDVAGGQVNKGLDRTHVGRRSARFFSTSFRGATGSTAPEAFPTLTIVPLRRVSLKLSRNLRACRAR